MPNALKYGSLRLLGPSGPVQACNGTAFAVNGGAKSTVIKRPVYEKMCLNVMLLVSVIGAKLPPHDSISQNNAQGANVYRNHCHMPT